MSRTINGTINRAAFSKGARHGYIQYATTPEPGTRTVKVVVSKEVPSIRKAVEAMQEASKSVRRSLSNEGFGYDTKSQVDYIGRRNKDSYVVRGTLTVNVYS